MKFLLKSHITLVFVLFLGCTSIISCTTLSKLPYDKKKEINRSIYNLKHQNVDSLKCKMTTSAFNAAAASGKASKVINDKESRTLTNYYFEVTFSSHNSHAENILLDDVPKLESSLGESRYRPFIDAVQKIIRADMDVLNALIMLPPLSEKIPHYLIKENKDYYEIQSNTMSARSYILYKDYSKMIFPLANEDSTVTANLTKENQHYFITSFIQNNAKRDSSFEYYFNYSTKDTVPLPVAVIVKKKDFDIELSYSYIFNNCQAD